MGPGDLSAWVTVLGFKQGQARAHSPWELEPLGFSIKGLRKGAEDAQSAEIMYPSVWLSY